jgi:competence protein ComGC
LEEKKRHGKWIFALAIILFVALIVGLVIYVFVPSLMRYEKLVVSSYYWVAVPESGVRQLVLELWNSGTYDLSIRDLLIDGAIVDSSSYGGYFGLEMASGGGGRLFVAPADATFSMGHTYNLTVVTSRSNRLSFAVKVEENNTRTENIQITDCQFYHSPPGSSQKVVGITVKSSSGTDVIIRKMWINNTAHDLTQQLWLPPNDDERSIVESFDWVNGANCTVAIETVAGSRREVNTTVHFP